MKSTRAWLLWFSIGLAALTFLKAEQPKASSERSERSSDEHFSDPAKILAIESAWKQRWDGKLDEFNRTAGVKILVEFHPKSPAAAEDKIPGAYMHALSSKLGTDRHGVLVVYFADEDDWRVWLGDDLTPIFVGRPGTVKELTDSKAIHDTKEAFFTATWTKSDAAFAALQKSAPPDRPATPADRLRIRTELLLDGLMDRLRPIS